MAKLSTADMVVGVVLVVLGALSLLGWFKLGFLVTIAAVAAIIVGILMLVGTVRGSTLFGVLLLVTGVLLLAPTLLKGLLSGILTTVAAIVLLVLGILKLLGKW